MQARTIRPGKTATVFTIGYEKRTGRDLIAALQQAGVAVLADIRQKPLSRVPDFRAGALRRLCEQAGIAYEGWSELGSTEQQRDHLKETGDFQQFERQFRTHVVEHATDALDRLAARVKVKPVALLCYERRHEECHRSVVADLLADRIDAAVVAL